MKEIKVIVLAPDSFKESMTAKEACEAMEHGIHRVNSEIMCIQVPMADGGEGTMQSLVDATNGSVYTSFVKGPMGKEVAAQFGILGDHKTGVIEMASASGIELVPPAERNPMKATTYGTGQLIKACLDQGVQKLLIGIGGSATNDGGVGMMQALGGKFLDKNGNELEQGGGGLNRLFKIDLTHLDKRIKNVEVEVACDVSNPLCGENGASNVFAPQKGATPEMVQLLEQNLRHYADIIKEQYHKDILEIPGAGAAGGLGAGLLAFLNGKLIHGIELVIKYVGLEEKVQMADMVWTGEGSIDEQTKFGKTPMGVASIAKKYHKPVIAFVGSVGVDTEGLNELGIDAVFGIVRSAAPLEQALEEGGYNLECTASNVTRLLELFE